ncbi:MAG TPA: hypothetical protein VFP86_16930 [bacterium]|nr:hypothetical protein [bacterium]
MIQDHPEPPTGTSSTLFTVRIWTESFDGEAEWRGKVQHLHSGGAGYFRGWQMLVEFIEAIVTRRAERGGHEQS